jgi:hypothetical protein
MTAALSREVGRLCRGGPLAKMRRADPARYLAFCEAIVRADSEADLSPENRDLLRRARRDAREPIRIRLRLKGTP